MNATRPTIFALSSGRPPAAIAVVRISGPRAGDTLKLLIGRMPAPREAALVRVRDPQTQESIDRALALWFPGPASETGEDVAELQLHGGRAVIAATLATLGQLDGLRPAEAGEFTRRAFENGKLDLTAVEGLADLVMAETEGQRRLALRQLQGALGARAEDWRTRLIQALALVEARIDFADEADVPEDLVAPALAIARSLADEMARALADERRGERLRDGLTVAIAGPVNAGKSTLLNRLARREAAIVSPFAGTTRDVIEVRLDLDGWPVTLVDTAGIRVCDDPVEMEGVRRARERAATADLVLWVMDAGMPAAQPVGNKPVTWKVRNKIDLLEARRERSETRNQEWCTREGDFRTKRILMNGVDESLKIEDESELDNEARFNISASTGEGVDQLLSAISAFAERLLAGAEETLVTRERHRRALQDTLEALNRTLSPDLVGREDLLAEDLRAAGQALGRLTGRVNVEDILDVIFRDFCIGK